jgi:hypothetical protein
MHEMAAFLCAAHFRIFWLGGEYLVATGKERVLQYKRSACPIFKEDSHIQCMSESLAFIIHHVACNCNHEEEKCGPASLTYPCVQS